METELKVRVVSWGEEEIRVDETNRWRSTLPAFAAVTRDATAVVQQYAADEAQQWLGRRDADQNDLVLILVTSRRSVERPDHDVVGLVGGQPTQRRLVGDD